jgi:hypothetical protein
VGYPRSGHSLIASLLDAHPNVVMAMEWDVFSHLRMGFNRHQIYYSLLRNSKLYALRKNNTWTGYSYKVTGMWQGSYQSIQVIGDKLGGRNSLIFKEDQSIIHKFTEEVQVPVRFIHVIRNPFDIISTMTLRSNEKNGNSHKIDNPLKLLPFIKLFFDRVEVVHQLRNAPQISIFDLYHEKFLKDPLKGLSELLDFLELDKSEKYLEKCAEIVYGKPKVSRNKIPWPESLINFVQEKIDGYDFLRGYTFNN